MSEDTMKSDKDLIQEKKKKYMKRYKKNMAMINRLEDKLFILETRLTSVASPRYSDEPKGTPSKTREDLILDKIELEDRINRLVKKGRTLRHETEELIDTLDDPLQAEILEAFFIECVSLDDIAERLGYTIRHVARLYGVGIANLDIRFE